jgi:hypothetical protein
MIPQGLWLTRWLTDPIFYDFGQPKICEYLGKRLENHPLLLECSRLTND